MSTRVAVCVSTFHRPAWLRELLQSLVALDLGDDEPSVTVVVVNNDPSDPEPAEACNEARAAGTFEIVLLSESTRGLAAPRNAALDHALEAHDFIAYIDDDSVAHPRWLLTLLEVQRTFDADVVTGPVVPRFVETPPDWIVRGGFFGRADRPTGSRLRHAFTNNLLLRSALLVSSGVRFDDRFNLIGGDDTHFTRRLDAAGARIVWANDAIVEDLVPPERATASWLVRRQRRAGMTAALIERDLRGAPVAHLHVAARALAWIPLAVGLWLVGLLTGRATRVRARCWTAWATGLALGLAGRFYEEYRHER